MENKGESDLLLEILEILELRDSRDSSSEKTPFVMTPSSGPDSCNVCSRDAVVAGFVLRSA